MPQQPGFPTASKRPRDDSDEEEAPPKRALVPALDQTLGSGFECVDSASMLYEKAAKQNLGVLAKLLLQRIRLFTRGYDPLTDVLGVVAEDEILRTLASMDKYIIMSLINNSLARDKVADQNIRQITNDLLIRSINRPACFLVSLVDHNGHPPTPAVLLDGIQLVRLYCTEDLAAQDLEIVMKMEYAIGHYSMPWTLDDLEDFFLRSYLHKSAPSIKIWGVPSADRVSVTLKFCRRLESKLNAICEKETNAAEQPIDFSLTYAGVSKNCNTQFSTPNTSNGYDHRFFVLNILLSALSIRYPGQYHLDPSVVMLPWYSGQSKVAESVIARLTESYVWEGSGFKVVAAGLTDNSCEVNIRDATWRRWEREAYVESVERQYRQGWSPYPS